MSAPYAKRSTNPARARGHRTLARDFMGLSMSSANNVSPTDAAPRMRTLQTHPFQLALLHEGRLAPLTATHLHVTGLPADPVHIIDLVEELAHELAKANILIDTEHLRDTQTHLGEALSNLTTDNGLTVGTMGSTPKRPTFLFPLITPTPIISHLAPPSPDDLPSSILTRITAFVAHSDIKVTKQYAHVRCTPIPHDVPEEMNQRRVAGTTTGPTWTHIWNITPLSLMLDNAHGILASDLITLLTESLSQADSDWIIENTVLLPMHYTIMAGDEETTKFRGTHTQGLALYVHGDPEDMLYYTHTQRMHHTLLEQATSTHGTLKLNGVTLYIETPEDPANPKRLQDSRIPATMRQPDLITIVFRDLYPWIQAPHLYLILTQVLHLPPSSICNIIPITARMFDHPTPPAHIRHKPDACVLLTTMHDLALLMRSSHIITQALLHLHNSTNPVYDPTTPTPTIHTLNTTRALKLYRPTDGPILHVNTLITKTHITHAVAEQVDHIDTPASTTPPPPPHNSADPPPPPPSPRHPSTPTRSPHTSSLTSTPPLTYTRTPMDTSPSPPRHPPTTPRTSTAPTSVLHPTSPNPPLSLSLTPAQSMRSSSPGKRVRTADSPPSLSGQHEHFSDSADSYAAQIASDPHPTLANMLWAISTYTVDQPMDSEARHYVDSWANTWLNPQDFQQADSKDGNPGVTTPEPTAQHDDI